ncbi:MAG: LysM peptidoglycan-binding domain-containing protein [Chloroflexi bacterium]|nr:LysM peptidoglycan-binding domain-containing protein [Chloroflexota bacterium]
MLAAVPLLSLVLVRMFWSGSSLWFLAVGIILLGVAAIVFLARRTQDQAYSQRTLDPEASRLPIVLMGVGVLFLAMLILPNYSGGGASSPQTLPAAVAGSEVAGIAQEPVSQAPVVSLPAAAEPAAASETYLVQSGDTLWDIALRFETTVEAIVAANELTDETGLSIGQELVIPPAGAAAEDGDSAEDAPVEMLP